MNTLRDVRLWHWRKVLNFRGVAARHEAYADQWEAAHPGKKCRHARCQARNATREANRHLGAVQALNDCFPEGDSVSWDHDTAERTRELELERRRAERSGA